MSEWWTYSLSDFLLFSPRTYRRLFELYNAQVWPAHLVAVGLGADDHAINPGVLPDRLDVGDHRRAQRLGPFLGARRVVIPDAPNRDIAAGLEPLDEPRGVDVGGAHQGDDLVHHAS